MANNCENLKILLSYIYQMQETIANYHNGYFLESKDNHMSIQTIPNLFDANNQENAMNAGSSNMAETVRDIKTKTLIVNKRKRNCFSMFEKINQNSWNYEENKENMGDEIFETQETLYTEGQETLSKGSKLTEIQVHKISGESKENYLTSLIEK